MAKAAKKKLDKPVNQAPDPADPLPAEEPPPKITQEPEPEAPAPESTSPEPTNQPLTEPEPDRRRPGRPSKDDPPIARSGIINRIQNLTSWEGTRVYLYRWEPFTDRKIGGRSSVSVKRYEGPFDEQDIMEDPGLGSGVYELIVNRTDPQTRQRRMIDSGMVKILNMKYPPKIPKGEWQNDERNKDWEWCRNLVEKSDLFTASPPTTPAPADPMLHILEKQIEAQERAALAQRQEMAELRKEMREASTKKDPGEQTLISVLAPFIPAIVSRLTAPSPPDTTKDMFMQYLMRQAENKENAAPKDPMTALDTQFELNKKMAEFYGETRSNGGRSRKSGTQELISDIVTGLAPVLQPIGQVLAAGILQQQRAAQQQQPGQQLMQQPQQQPAPPMITPGTAPPMMQQQQPGPQLVKTPTLETLAQGVIEHIRRNETGVDLGDWYIEEFGMQEFNDLRLEGKARIITDLNSVPAFTAAHLENGLVDKLVTELLTWEPADDEEDDDNGDDPPPDARMDAIKDGWNQEAR